MKAWLATIVVLLGSISASAADFEVDGICYNVTSSTDLAVEVTYKDYELYHGRITIPETVTVSEKTYKVTGIGYQAFADCSGLTSITLPEGLTSIGEYAFSNCSSLTSITLPEGLMSIGDWAFQYCSRLRTVINHSNLNIEKGSSAHGYVAYYAYRVIQNEVDYAGDFLFEKINDQYYLSAYLGDDSVLTLPEKYKDNDYVIKENAFRDFKKLISITLPKGLTSIGNSAFEDCRGLTSIVIPESLTSIGDNAFDGCKGLASITLPDGLTSIGESAFYACSGLTSITLPKGLTSTGNGAFRGCN